MEVFRKSGYGKLPAVLRDQCRKGELPKRAGHLFAIMGSYGPESRATVATMANDLGSRDLTVKRLQKALIKTGWIVLLKEGRGSGGSQPGTPREWWLNEIPNQHKVDAETKEKVAKLKLDGGLTGGGLEESENLEEPPLSKGAQADKSKAIKETPQPLPNVLDKKTAIAIFCRLWKAKYGQRYSVTGPDHGRLKVLLDNDLDPEYFEAKVKGYLASRDQWDLDHKHSLSNCCASFNKWPTLDGNGDTDGAPDISTLNI